MHMLHNKTNKNNFTDESPLYWKTSDFATQPSFWGQAIMKPITAFKLTFYCVPVSSK